MSPTRLQSAAPLLAALAAATLLLALPGAGTHALWSTPLPLSGTVGTGDLGIDDDEIPTGSWSRGGEPFSPAEDTLRPGDVLLHTVPGVSVTAVGDNLRAAFQGVSGAGIPAFIDLAVSSVPSTVHGTGPDDGPQRVDLVLTLTAAPELPEGSRSIDLTALTVTFGNGAGWTDTAVLDAGTLTTSAAPPPPATDVTAHLHFDPALDEDGEYGIFLQRPAPNTYLDWGWDTMGHHFILRAEDGLNLKPPEVAGLDVIIRGSFEGIGSCAQDEELVGALVYVGQWEDSGTVDASCAFKNAVHLEQVTSIPDTLTTTASMFENTRALHHVGLDGWDSSRVTDMSGMFRGSGLVALNGRLETSSVTDMSYMFADTPAFTGPAPLSSTENVITMKGMFQNATSFSGFTDAESRVHAPRLRDMSHMFDNAVRFDGPLQTWDVPNVETMDGMLRGAHAFAQDLSGWPVPRVTSWANFSDTLPETKWPRFVGPAEAEAEAGTTSGPEAEADMTAEPGTAADSGAGTLGSPDRQPPAEQQEAPAEQEGPASQESPVGQQPPAEQSPHVEPSETEAPPDPSRTTPPAPAAPSPEPDAGPIAPARRPAPLEERHDEH